MYTGVQRYLSFSRKIALAVAPAMVVAMVFSGLLIRPKLATAGDAERDERAARLVGVAAGAARELQVERGLSGRYLASRAQDRPSLEAQRRRTDEALAALDSADAVSGGAVATQAFVDAQRQITALRADLEQLRAAVDRNSIESAESVGAFSQRIDALTELMAQASLAASDAQFARRARTLLELRRAIDAESEAQSIIAAELERRTFSPAAARSFSERHEASLELLAIARRAADPELQGIIDRSLESYDAARLERMVERIRGTGSLAESITAEEWWAGMTARLDAFGQAESDAVELIARAAASQRSRAESAVGLYSLLVLAAITASSAAAALIVRSLVRRVERLSAQAGAIVSDALPQVLSSGHGRSGEAVARSLPNLDVEANDEIASLARSFNSVLRSAVETSLEHGRQQSQTMTTMLAALGRRNQGIIARVLKLLDSLEARQQDSENLVDLFRIDHMITRIRRNAENLLVLASEEPVRSWSKPVRLVHVIRGAISEIEDISRVTVENSVNTSALLGGRYAVDLSHLIAELLENATSYSMPDSPVVIRVERGPASYCLWVCDRGVGIPEEELAPLNALLANPPDVADLVAERVGLHVVARLAARLGVTVQLEADPLGGVMASVILPTRLFEAAPAHPEPLGERGGVGEDDGFPLLDAGRSRRSRLALVEQAPAAQTSGDGPAPPPRAPAPAPAPARQTPPAAKAPRSRPAAAPAAASAKAPAAPAETPAAAPTGLSKRSPGAALARVQGAAADAGQVRRLREGDPRKPSPRVSGPAPLAKRRPQPPLAGNDAAALAEAGQLRRLATSAPSKPASAEEMAEARMKAMRGAQDAAARARDEARQGNAGAEEAE